MKMHLRVLVLSLIILVTSAGDSFGHMVYIVSTPDNRHISVVFSDSLEPDTRVDMAKMSGSKFYSFKGSKGSELSIEEGRHSFSSKLPKTCDWVMGTAVYGISSRGDKPALLIYHPKAAVNRKADLSRPQKDSELEITVNKNGHDTRFRLWAKGKPVANSEGSLVAPDGTKTKLVTDKDGYTEWLHVHGQYAVYLKHTEDTTGTHNGVMYQEVRRYATLVIRL